MNPTVVIWILAAAVAVLVGREVGKVLFGANEKLMTKKRAAQKLAGILRDNGLRLLPALAQVAFDLRRRRRVPRGLPGGVFGQGRPLGVPCPQGHDADPEVCRRGDQ